MTLLYNLQGGKTNDRLEMANLSNCHVGSSKFRHLKGIQMFPNERWRETYDQWKTASPYDNEEEEEEEEEFEGEEPTLDYETMILNTVGLASV
jgi:hypothetical protein